MLNKVQFQRSNDGSGSPESEWSWFCARSSSLLLCAYSPMKNQRGSLWVYPRRFFTLILLLAMLHNMGISLFRFNGSLCRNENIASTGGAFLFLVLLLLGGFLLAKNDIPPWWIWCETSP